MAEEQEGQRQDSASVKLSSSTQATHPANGLDSTPIAHERKAAAATDNLSVSAKPDSAEEIKLQSSALDGKPEDKETQQRAVDLSTPDASSVSDGATVEKAEIVLKADKLNEKDQSPETELERGFAGDTPIDRQQNAAAGTDRIRVSAKSERTGDVKPQSSALALEPEAKQIQQQAVDLPNLDALSVSDGATVDKPEIVLKADKLNEEIESPETELKKVFAGDTPYTSAKTFEDLNLSEALLRGLYSEMKFEKPSKIQADTLPMILTPPYVNLIAQAHNGSGKTTCFVLGMLGRVDPQLKAPQALCVCPTRELAIQNEEVLLKMGKYTGITSVCAVPFDSPGSLSTRRDPIVDQVVIGTPGTLKRWMTRDKLLRTKDIKILVFDEADHMLDQDGFQDDSMRILRDIQRNRGSCQILLFSATYNEKVKQFALRNIPNANYVFVKKEELSLDVIKQYKVRCPDRNAKVEVLRDRIFPIAEKLGQSIIFVRTRESASELHRKLEADGHKCTSIQGGMRHEDRDHVIREFRSGNTKILIATDVLARGFDQAQVTLVVNYDLPIKSHYPYDPDYEVYLHRIGRSGRFGRKGAAFNLLVSGQDETNLNRIKNHFDRDIPEVVWDDDDAFEKVLKDAGLA